MPWAWRTYTYSDGFAYTNQKESVRDKSTAALRVFLGGIEEYGWRDDFSALFVVVDATTPRRTEGSLTRRFYEFYEREIIRKIP